MRAPSWHKFSGSGYGYNKGYADVRYTTGLGVIVCVCGVYHELPKQYQEKVCSCGRTFRMRVIVEAKEKPL